MAYMTARKRATGMGSAKTGTSHFWNMTISSVALLVLVPLFVFTFGPMLGEPYPEVVAYFSRPFPAIVAALTLLVGFVHFKNGAQVMIEDYVQGLARKISIIAVICISYAAAATGLFAIARLAL
ncbi:succinate dehydrogenase, hydrophobic membrane anchor protein [Tranquillimonas alkanivorans]|uniref:Succinate dehydrogenase hydrophobic membrane anchor subunit n=1 Tax=Tranquillimonas alkanivorans TaxID=441119 RepID=A0A1I5PG42_9RHOB|nr:succinate dehydrogenase, hydrophobic membrane anchor protein [Tranquillimonas alkanivorans]SFP32827.1 succinate dehydrogenase subunit D [Tranquillimonas alkanivorans]